MCVCVCVCVCVWCLLVCMTCEKGVCGGWGERQIDEHTKKRETQREEKG